MPRRLFRRHSRWLLSTRSRHLAWHDGGVDRRTVARPDRRVDGRHSSRLPCGRNRGWLGWIRSWTSRGTVSWSWSGLCGRAASRRIRGITRRRRGRRHGRMLRGADRRANGRVARWLPRWFVGGLIARLARRVLARSLRGLGRGRHGRAWSGLHRRLLAGLLRGLQRGLHRRLVRRVLSRRYSG